MMGRFPVPIVVAVCGALAVQAGAARADTPPLTIAPPADITVAASGPCGQTYCATVSYSYSVSGGTPPYRLVCNLDSGSQFTVGSHTISCIAQDAAGDSTPQASFTLTVTGGGPPPPPPPPPASLTISPPADITVAATGPCGQTYCAQVSYSYTVSGGTPPYRLVCNLDSGSQFTVGSHTISCIAQDAAGDSTPQSSFTLTVTGGGPPLPPPPPPASLTISPPVDITVPATGPCGQTYCAQVSYSYTVSGGTPPYRLVCNLDSGSQFTVGSHTISCIAQDSVGNSTPQASFTLTVTAPASGSGGGGGGSGGGGTGSSGGSSGGGGNSSSSPPATGGSGGGSQPIPLILTAPSIVSASTTGGVYVTVTTRHTDTAQTLCWQSKVGGTYTCLAGHGAWRVKLAGRAGKHLLLLEAGGAVVARKTVVVRPKT